VSVSRKKWSQLSRSSRMEWVDGLGLVLRGTRHQALILGLGRLPRLRSGVLDVGAGRVVPTSRPAFRWNARSLLDVVEVMPSRLEPRSGIGFLVENVAAALRPPRASTRAQLFLAEIVTTTTPRKGPRLRGWPTGDVRVRPAVAVLPSEADGLVLGWRGLQGSRHVRGSLSAVRDSGTGVRRRDGLFRAGFR